MSARAKLEGKRFGRLTVVCFSHKKRFPSASVIYWKCLCDCGEQSFVPTVYLTSGHTKSCGCFREDNRPTLRFKHGFCRKKGPHKIWVVWREMFTRCYNKKNHKYKDYGGRGITVCKRWMVFENFRDDMLPTWKEGLSIDRINNDGNYEPSNCRWADKITQANNTRTNVKLKFKGVVMTVAQIARACGLPPHILYGRIRLGWELNKMTSTPIIRL